MGLFKRNKEQIQVQEVDFSHLKATSGYHGLRRLLGKECRQESSSSHIQEESSRDGSASPDLGSRPPSKHEYSSVVQSLWDRAYDALRKNEPKLVEDYEELLSSYAPKISTSSDESTEVMPPGDMSCSVDRQFQQAQLKTIITAGLQRAEEKKTKYIIAGHEFNLTNRIDQAAKLVLWAKDWIGEAVKQSPDASIVWAGVCIILPLLTNPMVADEANRDGFAYVTTRMQYYYEFEPLLQRLCRNREVSPALAAEVHNHVIQLYQRILEFQIRSVLRFYKNSIRLYLSDVILPEDWEKMVLDIKEFEGTIDRTLIQINQVVARQELESISKKSGDALEVMRQFLSVSELQVRIAADQLGVAQRELEIQEDEAKKKLSDEQNDCHQLFRLTDKSKDATYEWYKGRVEPRIDGTCEWFLNHENFRRWLEQDSGPLLVSADPGCGKSVLAKYLIDIGLPRSATICYFFFKDQDQNTARQALCALIHQLFSLKPLLIEHGLNQFKKDGRGLINSTSSLWTVLRNAVQDPQAGPIIIVLDALDECDELEFEDMMRNIDNQFHGHRSSSGKLKYLLTSRPYEQIVSKFRRFLDAFPDVRIPGEEESEIIGQEVNQVIKHQVENLAKDKGLSDHVKDHLAERLLEIPHRTYLWAYLVFDYLKKENFKKTRKGIDYIMEALPKNIEQAYEKILGKCKKEEESTVRKALSIILAACRPLTVVEMNVALNVDNTAKSIHDLDLEEEEDFKSRLRSWCGLFVSIHHGKVYFLHQTAREFLLGTQSPETISPGTQWQHSITSRDAHRVLTEICVIYLDFLNYDGISTGEGLETNERLSSYTLLDYSAQNWSVHFLEARFSKDAGIIPCTLRICNPDLNSCSTWFNIWWDNHEPKSFPKPLTDLAISSWFGYEVIARLLIEEGADLESENGVYRTPLWWAAKRGHAEVVKLLLDKGAKPDPDGPWSIGPLGMVIRYGYVEIVKLLLEKGADLEAKEFNDKTPLLIAIDHGHADIVKLLLEKGADLESKGPRYTEQVKRLLNDTVTNS